MAIEFYKEFGELGYLANYSNYGFYKNGIFYKTVEHYYQSEKFDDEDIKNKIINVETPKEASNIGRDRNNIRKDNFNSIKNKVMYEGILEKFRQNRNIAYKLIETRNREIAETTVDEYYWGIGKDKTGQNIIGKILMQVRSKIKKEILESIINNCKNEKEVYVIGHRNPDADSIFASYLLSIILKSFGINAIFAVLDKNYEYCSSDKNLIDDFLKEKPTIVRNVHDKKFVLVDHNNLGELSKETVIGAIDHHIISGEVYDTLQIEYASTCLLIYDLFRDVYNFSDDERLLIALSVLADTEYLCSKRYREADKELCETLNVTLDVNSIQKKYFKINDFSFGIEENLKTNYEEYGDTKRSMIYSFGKEYELYYQDYVEAIKDEENRLLIWCDFENKKTYVNYGSYAISYDHILTSTNLILKDLIQNICAPEDVAKLTKNYLKS